MTVSRFIHVSENLMCADSWVVNLKVLYFSLSESLPVSTAQYLEQVDGLIHTNVFTHPSHGFLVSFHPSSLTLETYILWTKEFCY